MNKIPKILTSILMLVFGLSFVIIPVIPTLDYINTKKHYNSETIATLIDTRSRPSMKKKIWGKGNESITQYFAIVGYIADIKPYINEFYTGEAFPGNNGDKLKLFYNPDNPNEFYLSDLYDMPFSIYSIVGMIVFGVAAIILAINDLRKIFYKKILKNNNEK